jgi:hypothetical protein
MNTTRMHVFTHVRPEYQGKSGMPGNEYADGMWEHDGHVGLLLKTLDDLGIANDTLVEPLPSETMSRIEDSMR